MRTVGVAELWFIILALRWTLLLSAITFVGGGIGGLVVAILRIAPNRAAQLVAAGFIELFQGTPLLLQLFVAYFGLGLFGFDVDAWTAASFALSVHAAAFLGEIWRGSIQSVPRAQWEAGRALSLHYGLILRLIVLPQALRAAIAPTVGFMAQLIKATAVTALIGFTEITRAGQLVTNATLEPFTVYFLVAGLYFFLCWPISRASQGLEKRLGGGRQRIGRTGRAMPT